MMYQLIKAFPAHIKESLAIYRTSEFSRSNREIRNVVIAGLGGSGIGGTIVADIARPYATVPVTVVKDYHIPAFTGPETLFIASSYSGGTEETLEALAAAEAKGAAIICITSGGKLAEIARAKGFSLASIPGGHPPRAAFGYSFAQLICIFTAYGLLPDRFIEELETSADWLNTISGTVEQESLALATALSEKIPVIYSVAALEGVAVRFRQQLNENAKMLAWHGVVPEMNHNELVGWTEKNNRLAVVYLRSPEDYKRNVRRMEINRGIIGHYTDQVYEVMAQGNGMLQHLLYLIHFLDWVSFHLAGIRKVDIMEIKVIDYLKGELSQMQ